MCVGFESTLHEVTCSDGQCISILRTWNGEEYACLPDVWRKNFPEVNRNHFTSVAQEARAGDPHVHWAAGHPAAVCWGGITEV